MKRLLVAMTLFVPLLSGSAPALAVPLGVDLATLRFRGVTTNSPESQAIGERQLFVTVQAITQSQLSFKFTAAGPNNNLTDAIVISEIYFQDLSERVDHTQAGMSWDYVPGQQVAFHYGAKPSELSSANNANPAFVTSFATEANKPEPEWGVSPNEQLKVFVNMRPGKLVEDVLIDLKLNRFRIGLHNKAYANGQSESYVNLGPDILVPIPTPEPGTIALLGLGILGLGLRRRRA
jgi:hypothetical protein